jgi:hypothetical protein
MDGTSRRQSRMTKLAIRESKRRACRLLPVAQGRSFATRNFVFLFRIKSFGVLQTPVDHACAVTSVNLQQLVLVSSAFRK